jgi:anti-sigma regulatory factor (Ser/Thr protein kinase)
MRRRLRAALADGGLPAGADDGERLLLAVEELASNGLRHGRPPVDVTITAAGLGWVLEVSDGATARPPTPAIGRDPALGGMGLGLVARLSRAHGWAVEGDRKTVWAHIGYRTPPAPPPHERIRRATTRSRELTASLALTEARIAATLHRLAAEAAVAGRTDRARAYRAVAERAQRDAERARWKASFRLRPPVRGAADPGAPVARYPAR